jgi:hypothetical protein
MSKRYLIPLFADTHGGHKLGLMNPEALIWDTSLNEPELVEVPEPNSWQELMWDDYLWCISKVKDLAGEDEVIPHHLGDITQGSKYPVHLVTHNLRNQARIGYFNMKPWLDNIENITRFRFISGTPSHLGNEYSSLTYVYELISSDYTDVGFKISHHALQNVGEEVIDVAHHGPGPGRRKWLSGNILRYYLKDIVIRAAMNGEAIPRIVARGHFHTPVEETVTETIGGKFHKTTGIILPSFSGVNGYARQVIQSVSFVSTGLCCLEFVDGWFVENHWFIKTRDVRTRETLWKKN